MRREEAKNLLYDKHGEDDKLIDQIYNNHEAQLKLASDVYSTDKMHMYQELKAKDKITQDIKEAYELKSIAYDLLLEAIQLKDDEIERLKGKTQILEVLVDNTKDIIEAQTRMCRTKARSIVAMLFWVFAKNRRLHKTNKYFSQDAVTESYFCFQQAYKMLKAQQ